MRARHCFSIRRGAFRAHDGAALAGLAALGLVLGLWLLAGAVETVVPQLMSMASAAPVVP